MDNSNQILLLNTNQQLESMCNENTNVIHIFNHAIKSLELKLKNGKVISREESSLSQVRNLLGGIYET